MSETMQIALITALINGAVTWGIVSTKLAWLRRDMDKVEVRITACEGYFRFQNTTNNKHFPHA